MDNATPSADADAVEAADSMAGAYRRLHRLIESSPEVLSMVPTQRLGVDFMEASREPEITALRKGARLRTLYVDGIADHEPSMGFIRDILAAGAEARALTAVPTWLTIVGRQVVVLPRDPSSDRGVLLLRGAGHVDTARWFFAHAWRSAQALAPAGGGAPFCLTPRERQVLVCLARGVKDEAGARALGISPRTYRRYVTELCDRLGASSRFEAGVMAMRTGLLRQSARPARPAG